MSGIGSSGLRAYVKRASGLYPGERAAAGACGVDVEHGDADWKPLDLAFAGGRWFQSGIEQRDIG